MTTRFNGVPLAGAALLFSLATFFWGNTAAAQSSSESGAIRAEEQLQDVYNYVLISDRLSTGGQIAYDQVSLLKEAGYDLVINLASASEGGNALEGFLVAKEGLTYINIPVPFSNPPMRDLQMFFDVMEANRDRKVFVHCAANMRASAFVYLYRTLVQNVSDEEALPAMLEIWNPDEVEAWSNLVRTAKERGASR